MAMVVMHAIIVKISTLIWEEYAKHESMQMELKSLKDELCSMNAVLEMLADMEELDLSTKVWRNQVMDMAFNIEDIIDDFMHQVGEDANISGFGSIRRVVQYVKALIASHNFMKKIQELKVRVKDVSERRKRYKIDGCAPCSSYAVVDPRVSSLYSERGKIVGLEGPKVAISKLLALEDATTTSLRVVSIVGFGGLGKTTLAIELYRNTEGQYDCRAFISVSQRVDMTKLLNLIISKVGMPQSAYSYDVQDLIDSLKNYLVDKRYFFVIDDIWDESAWQIIRCAFPDNEKGSKVITTTRIETVAKASCNYQSEFIYKLKPLDDWNSRKLFLSRVGNVSQKTFVEISDEILKRCGGLPLAIISIASLLASQSTRSIEHWNYVRSSFRSDLRSNTTLEGMRHVLKLSYNNLPYHLKICVLYIGMYPEDYEIVKQDLLRQWVAEGFVIGEDGRNAEEVAGSYFNELVNRSMIQPIITCYNSAVQRCKVHDMILDLIRLKCEEENFLRAVDNVQEITTALQSKVRRISLHFDYGDNEETATPNTLSMKHIRSLALFCKTRCLLPTSALKYIRVLYLECQLPEYQIDLTPICKLSQLRYLKIAGKPREASENWVSQRLEAFDVAKPYAIRLPSDIVHLPYLTHLRVPRGTRLPDGVQNMKSLRSLGHFEVSVNSMDNLNAVSELINLKELWIWWCHENDITRQQRVVDAFWCSISILINRNLRVLQVDPAYPVLCPGPVVVSDSLETCQGQGSLERLHTARSFMFLRVPGWICKRYHKLSSLDIQVKMLTNDDVDLLAGLPNLTELFLCIRKSPEERIIFADRMMAFPLLQYFQLWCFAPRLVFKTGAMPNLQSLELRIHAQGLQQHRWFTIDGLEHLLRVKKICAIIHFESSDEDMLDIIDAETILRDVIDIHPGQPVVDVKLRDNRTSLVKIHELSS